MTKEGEDGHGQAGVHRILAVAARTAVNTIRADAPAPLSDVRCDLGSIDRYLIQKPSHSFLNT